MGPTTQDCTAVTEDADGSLWALPWCPPGGPRHSAGGGLRRRHQPSVLACASARFVISSSLTVSNCSSASFARDANRLSRRFRWSTTCWAVICCRLVASVSARASPQRCA
eukprot:EG_transcript_43055